MSAPLSRTTRPSSRRSAQPEKSYGKSTEPSSSSRRTRQPEADNDGDVVGAGLGSRESRASHHREPSFIAETSFIKSPLNSRVTSTSVNGKGKHKAKEDNLSHVPLEVQEAMILEDLLFVLSGIEGTHITFHPEYSQNDNALQGIRFVTSPSLDPSLRDLVERILPLATYYTAVAAFIEARSHLDFGLVNHALCASIREMLKDYHTLLSQLEHAFTTSPSFTLQKLWFYVHPTLHTLSLIYTLTTELIATETETNDADGDSDSTSPSDAEEEARNEALGLGGARLKAVLSEITTSHSGGGGVAKGGEVLAIIHARMQHMAGDPAARALYTVLSRAAATPYVSMLRTWTTTGRLIDPHEELCIKESKFIDRGLLEVDYTDEYWERRYTLRDGSTYNSAKRHQAGVPHPRPVSGRLPGGACVPPLLEGWKHKALLAGKYLNVIRECGMEVGQNEDEHWEDGVHMDEERFYKSLEDAYTHANRTLLQLLLRDQDLVPRLRSLKKHFFLSQSSFLTHFLDLAQFELNKSARTASLVKLQSLLDLALNVDVNAAVVVDAEDGVVQRTEEEAYKDDVKVTLATSGLYEWLLNVVNVSGMGIGEEGVAFDLGDDTRKTKEKEKDDKKTFKAIDAIALDYNVKFPLSLVISRKTILRYQLLFRFLFHLKHVEQALSTMWIEHKTQPWRKRVDNEEFERWRRRVFLLRARMLAWVHQILAFATFEVLEPNWHALEDKLAKVTTVDQLLRDHVDFLDTCLKECMLTSSKLLKAYSRLIVTCSTFALYTAQFTKSASTALSALETTGGDQAMTRRWDFLNKFETNFNHWFKVHLDCVQFYASSENVSLLPLVVRLTSVKSP